MKTFLIAGARPNFMKISPIIKALRAREKKLPHRPTISWELIHTGQHYDYKMSQAFFEDLDIPKPDYFLESGSGSHAQQTAKIMISFEQICSKKRPDIVLVVGDVNSTLACSIVAKKLGISVAHIEAGLRSFDSTMPEEINRIVTDSICDHFFVTEKSAIDNLIKEGKQKEKIYFVGQVMVDNLMYQLNKIKKIDQKKLSTYSLKKRLKKYIFITLHRPSNVDHKYALISIFNSLDKISSDFPIIFPVHPRTKKMMESFKITTSKNINLLPPLGFRESLFLWKDAQLVMTDSGGLQEETTALKIPCLTLRENTERPVTIEIGTNILVGNKENNILSAYEKLKKNGPKKGIIPPKWDGKASERIVNILENLSDTI